MTDTEMKPLLVPKHVARKLIGVGPTKFWQLTKNGTIELVQVGGSEMVRYSSLEKLAAPKQAAA